jgi:hypothetical protein
MVNLALDVKFMIEIPDGLNERLEQGEEAAFKQLEEHLSFQLNVGKLLPVSKLRIEDAGEHNVADWEERS